MPYDFDTPRDRRHSDSIKWAVGENELPMWVADMDFPAADEIRRALQARLDHGVFGYADLPQGWARAYVSWWKERHGWTFSEEDLIFSTGVVPILSSVVRKLTTPNENVVLMTPVYNIFFNSVVNNGRRVLESPLRYENGAYSVDFADLEEKLSQMQTTLLILCNPHNPVGKIWDRETLQKIGALCKKHHVLVVSDEIHCDLTRPGTGYVPFASVSEECAGNCVVCLAPTKAFNLAGLQSAAAVVPDPYLRHKVRRALNTDEVAEPNVFAGIAAEAAFTQGGAWLDELRAYVFENRRLVETTIAERIPQIYAVPGDATYLAWLDLHGLPQCERFPAFLRENTGLFCTDGKAYGAPGKGFLRMNLACPRSLVIDGMQRLEAGVKAFIPALPGNDPDTQ